MEQTVAHNDIAFKNFSTVSVMDRLATTVVAKKLSILKKTEE